MSDYPDTVRRQMGRQLIEVEQSVVTRTRFLWLKNPDDLRRFWDYVAH